jgi:hypothetical protein
MKLVHRRTLKMGEDKYVYPPAEALVLVKRALAGHRKIEGLAELRRDARVYFDRYVWQQVERGEWLLLKPEARSFDWAHFEPHARERRMMALLENPPPQIEPPKLIFRVVDSESAELIVKRSYMAMFDGQTGGRRLDWDGFGTLPVASKAANITLRLAENY